MRWRRTLSPFLAALGLLGSRPHADAAALWENRPPKIIQTSDANYPAALSARGILEGEVRAVLNVDRAGRLVDCLITAYTQRELADELLLRLREWHFEPAMVRGEPANARFDAVFGFKAKGAVVSFSALEALSSHAYRLIGESLTSLVCKPTELDRPLAALHVVQPLHPGKTVQPSQLRGTAVLDFYVDAEGRPRIPVVSRSSHDAFALAAVAALEQWRFSPPTRQGRPTAVRVVQEFVFSGS